MKDEDVVRKLGIWGELVDLALDDDHITIDESKLLKNILDNAKVYRKLLDKAFEDGHISREDKQQLLKQRKKITDAAYQEAKDDNRITDEELRILTKALEITKKLEINEKQFDQYWT